MTEPRIYRRGCDGKLGIIKEDKIRTIGKNPLRKSARGKRNADAKKLYDLIVKEVGEDTIKRVQEFCEACGRDLEEAHEE